MTGARRILAAGIMAALGLMAADRQAEAQPLKLTLKIRNDANLSNDLIRDAQSKVNAIYANAGVEIAWVDEAADLMVVLLSRDNAALMKQIPDAMGFAPCSKTARGAVAYVLQGRVDTIAQGYSAETSTVLAIAMAHEVGHLLLPFNAHSGTGVMRAEMNQADFKAATHGRLVFTPTQIAQIDSRMSPVTAN